MQDLEITKKSKRNYIPAAGYDRFLPLYDLVTKFLGLDEARAALVDQVPFQATDHVLDVGCGTGSLAVLIKKCHPEVEVVGLDPDPNALARARRKAEQAGVSAQFDHGYADSLQYPTALFDYVFSSFMFHHLQPDEQEKTLREVYRVLKPGGRLYLLDFEAGRSDASAVHWVSRLLHSHAYLKHNSERQLLMLMTKAGFSDVKRVGGRTVLWRIGIIGYYQASVPKSTSH